jgi:5-oxoprolinase (ATP-hydrolysing)
MTMSILSERRVLAPNGINGGKNGKRGENYYYQNYNTKEEKKIILGAKNTIPVNVGDVFEVQTPGGGGYGKSI